MNKRLIDILSTITPLQAIDRALESKDRDMFWFWTGVASKAIKVNGHPDLHVALNAAAKKWLIAESKALLKDARRQLIADGERE